MFIGFWSLYLLYHFLTITYIILLCGDVESTSGPNLHYLQAFEDYEKQDKFKLVSMFCIYKY